MIPSRSKEILIDATRQDARARDLLKHAGCRAPGSSPPMASGSTAWRRMASTRGSWRASKAGARWPIWMMCSIRWRNRLSCSSSMASPIRAISAPACGGRCSRRACGDRAQDRAVRPDRRGGQDRLRPAETVPYVMVTNLARTLRELQERDIWVIGTAGEAESDLYAAEWPKATAWVAGRRGRGHAPPDPRKLRSTGQDSHARHGREPERLGGGRRFACSRHAAACPEP